MSEENAVKQTQEAVCETASYIPSKNSYTETAFGLDLEMVWIPEGTFRMGGSISPESTVMRYGGRVRHFQHEYPAHVVALDGFWMGKFQVTNAQYRRFKPEHSSMDYRGYSLDGDDQPVVYVSWEDANAYCEWLSLESGKAYSLPTEAQWEYACRAGTNTVRYWGDDDESMGLYANTADDAARKVFLDEWPVSIRHVPFDFANTNDGYEVTSPVGSFLPNAFGLHDMIGNVYEYCADWYGEDYYGFSLQCNPPGPSRGEHRIVRGGSWRNFPYQCRAAFRGRTLPHETYNIIGFRIACSE